MVINRIQMAREKWDRGIFPNNDCRIFDRITGWGEEDEFEQKVAKGTKKQSSFFVNFDCPEPCRRVALCLRSSQRNKTRSFQIVVTAVNAECRSPEHSGRMGRGDFHDTRLPPEESPKRSVFRNVWNIHGYQMPGKGFRVLA